MFAVLAAFTILVLLASIRAGKTAGFALTVVTCGIAAYLMPPEFSFRIGRTRDVVTLAVFGTTALVLTQTARPRQRPAFATPAWAPAARPSEADLADVIAEFTASEAGARLREVAVAIAVQGYALPCTTGDTFRILSDTVNAALAVPGVARISIYAAQQPSARRLKIVAHRVWPTPENAIIMIGQRDSACVPAVFPGWPANARANWFDNGYARIYQISVATTEASGQTRV